jgi:hypothetical protein
VRLFRVHPIAFLSADACRRYCRIGTTDAPFFPVNQRFIRPWQPFELAVKKRLWKIKGIEPITIKMAILFD